MSARRAPARGFTIPDLTVAIVIIMLMVSLLLPAVQAARESARRLQCQHHLTQIGIALMNYQHVHRVLPPGSVSTTQPVTWLQPPDGLGWMAQILPQMGEENTWLQLDATDPFRSFGAIEAAEAASVGMQVTSSATEDGSGTDMAARTSRLWKLIPRFNFLLCPSQNVSRIYGVSLYAGCHHSTEQPISERGDGLFSVNSSESLEDIPDGRSATLLAGELSPNLPGHGWIFGDRSSLRNGGKLEDAPKSARMIDFSQLAAEEISEEGRAQLQLQSQEVGTFGSLHPWQVNFLFADGSVRALSKKIDPALFSSLISRADGSPLSDEGF